MRRAKATKYRFHFEFRRLRSRVRFSQLAMRATFALSFRRERMADDDFAYHARSTPGQPPLSDAARYRRLDFGDESLR